MGCWDQDGFSHRSGGQWLTTGVAGMTSCVPVTTNQVSLGLFESCSLGPKTATGVPGQELSHCPFCHVVLAKTNLSKARKTILPIGGGEGEAPCKRAWIQG